MKKINITATILIALLLIAALIAVANTVTASTVDINNTSAPKTSTDDEIVKLINKFEVEDIKVIDNECVYIRGRVDIAVENKVHVVICGQKVYIFAEVQVPPPPPS